MSGIKDLNYRVNEATYIDAYKKLGWVLAKMGKYDEAINAYDKLFIIEPDDFRSHYNKAWVLAKMGKYDEAVKEYDRSLDWENQYGRKTKATSILGPLGTYQDVANAYEKAKVVQSSSTEPPSTQSHDVVIYQTDFSSDPNWQTSHPRQYYWDQKNQSYHFRSDTNLGNADINVPYTETSFRLEYDITIPHADPGTLVRFGLVQYNTSEDSQGVLRSYNSQNAILGEFKSWLTGRYRNLENGDKAFQIYAMNNKKSATDPRYNFCRINREESVAITSFGDNRTYHVIIVFDPVTETISYTVTDNLHEKTYYDCTGIYAKMGTFSNMNRLILVAEPSENAYIEGSIDNVVLSVPAATTHTIPTENENKLPALNNSSPAATKSSPSLILPLLGIVIMGIIIAFKIRDE